MNTTATPSSLENSISGMRHMFDTGQTRPLEWRKAQLRALRQMIRENEKSIFAALQTDLGKAPCETFASETGFVVSEVTYALKRLERWAKPRRVATGLPNQPGKARIVPEPLGVVLIMAPWNYPFMLCLSPLIGALAAGNCAALKPSELTPETSSVIARLVASYLDPQAVQVFEGGAETAQGLLAQRFDHIFYTGGEKVGRIVMHAAAENLTPVTLELGGKSPCILARDADIEVAARRIAWGKCLNAGQTCVAPDYILAEPGVVAPFIKAFGQQVQRFYGGNIQASPDYARIVSQGHFERLKPMLEEGEVAFGGQSDAADRFIAPTILRNLPEGAEALRSEIFGPILPVIEVKSLDDAVAYIKARPKPLALYLFSDSAQRQQQVVENTSSGSVCINDVVMQLAVPELPFGGVGASGMGTYHGRASFDTFSHMKAVLKKATFGEIPLRYPPYTAQKLKWLRRFL